MKYIQHKVTVIRIQDRVMSHHDKHHAKLNKKRQYHSPSFALDIIQFTFILAIIPRMGKEVSQFSVRLTMTGSQELEV
jgi:hypothetical protein